MTVETAIADAVRAAQAPLVERLDKQNALLERLLAATPTPAETAMLSVRQAAQRVGLSMCSIRRHIADGTLASTKIGGSIRVPSSALRVSDRAEIARLSREARGS